MELIFNAVQAQIIASQEQLRRKVMALQNKMQSGPKFQAQIEKEQADSIREAIAILDDLKPVQKWNLLVLRQCNTFKGQMLFQIKDFESAAPLLDKALVLEPLTLAMQMVLMYKKGDLKKLEKAFYKGTARFKDEKGTLLYALYSWILVAEDRISKRWPSLMRTQKCESEILKRTGITWSTDAQNASAMRLRRTVVRSIWKIPAAEGEGASALPQRGTSRRRASTSKRNMI